MYVVLVLFTFCLSIKGAFLQDRSIRYMYACLDVRSTFFMTSFYVESKVPGEERHGAQVAQCANNQSIPLAGLLATTRDRRPRSRSVVASPWLRCTMKRSTSAQKHGGRNVGGGDDEADSIPITQTFASATVRPEKPMTKRKDGGGIASAAVGGLDADTEVDNDVGDSKAPGHQNSSQTQKGRQQQQRPSSSSMSKLFGACGPAEALDLDLVRGATTKLRIPTRTESVHFVKNLSLPERLRDVKDGLNAKLGACVSTSKGSGNNNTDRTSSGSKSSAVGQDNALSSTNDQAIHRSSATATTTASVDESSNVSHHTFETKDTKQDERLEEMHHLERMTSWNTLGTISHSTNADDASIEDNINALGMLGLEGRSAGGGDEGALEEFISSTSPKQPIVDDDGNEISSEMISSLKARREQRAAAAAASQTTKKKSSSRRRVVQFDYPPISSLRECPRHDPADQGKLFFSEEELDELEEDRIACKMVDDVEVVAVPAVASANPSATASSPTGPGERGEKKMTKREARKLALSASQKLKRSASASMTPNGGKAFGFVRSASASLSPNGSRAFGIADNSTADDDDGGDDGKSPTASPANAAGNNSGAPEGRTTDNGGGPLIKGVQIYLRQRSTNEVVKKGKR